MIKTFAFIAAAAVIASAVPASAQVDVRIGGDGYHRGYHGDGFRRSRAEIIRPVRGYHRGWDHPHHRDIVIVR